MNVVAYLYCECGKRLGTIDRPGRPGSPLRATLRSRGVVRGSEFVRETHKQTLMLQDPRAEQTRGADDPLAANEFFWGCECTRFLVLPLDALPNALERHEKYGKADSITLRGPKGFPLLPPDFAKIAPDEHPSGETAC